MKSGFRVAQITYHGSATIQNDPIAIGWTSRKAARQCELRRAHIPIAPPASITAAGPFARTASPRYTPKDARPRFFRRRSLETAPDARSNPCDRNTPDPEAIAKATNALKSISGVAARENPIAPTEVQNINGANSAGVSRKFSASP